jgi:hypothetical protein
MNAVGPNSRNVKVGMVNEWALYPLKKLIPGFNLSFMPSVNPKHQDVWLVQTQDDQTITDMLELIAPTMRECGTKYELLLLLQAMREPGNRNRGADVALTCDRCYKPRPPRFDKESGMWECGNPGCGNAME